MKVINSYIKKKENKEWLENNFETFLDYMSKHHSIYDCWHTVLDMSSFNDAYIEGLIKNVEAADKKKDREEKVRRLKKTGKKVSEMKETTAVEKKIAKMEEASKKNEDPWSSEDCDLFD